MLWNEIKPTNIFIKEKKKPPINGLTPRIRGRLKVYIIPIKTKWRHRFKKHTTRMCTHICRSETTVAIHSQYSRLYGVTSCFPDPLCRFLERF